MREGKQFVRAWEIESMHARDQRTHARAGAFSQASVITWIEQAEENTFH